MKNETIEQPGHYSCPIVAILLYGVGAVLFLLGGLIVISSISGDDEWAFLGFLPGIALGIGGLISVGLGQIIDLVGRTAYNTQLTYRAIVKS